MVKKTTKSILVVDDQPNNLSLATSILKPLYDVLLANDGKKAIVMAKEKKPDLILLDIMMPGINGFLVCGMLKENPKTKDIPILFLTALSDSDSFEKAYKVGGVDYVTKPFKATELLVRVKTHLSIKENQDNLNQLNEELRISDMQKSKILSVISHDLTNSISGSKQLLELLIKKSESKTLTPEILETRLHALYKGISGTNQILQDLLWWSRNQLKKIQFNPVTLAMDDLIQKTATQLDGQLSTKKISLSVTTDKELTAHCDPEMLIIILRNLIGNAIKFSHPGNTVEVAGKNQEENILISVSDHGVGIPEENLNQIFALNANLSTPGTNGEKGTGLGLNLCMGLVSSWGGKIWVESEPEKGSTFFFTVPKNNNKAYPG